MATLYGIRNCDGCRKAQKWLQDSDFNFDFSDVRETDIGEALLERWLKTIPWDRLLNRRSTTWRNIPAHERDGLDQATARNLILKYPTVMKRPVLDLGDRVILGFDISAYQKLKASE
jgi:arsenate reductase